MKQQSELDMEQRNASLVAQSVKNLSVMWETQVWTLGWEDPLEKGIHFSILAWRLPWTEKPGRPLSMVFQHVLLTWLSNQHTHTHGTTDWFKIGQGCILSPCLFNLHAEYIMWNARLDEAQAGIKIAGRNISNLRYADDTTLMAEREEELKRLLMKVKEESEKAGLKLNVQKLTWWHLVPSLHGK